MAFVDDLVQLGVGAEKAGIIGAETVRSSPTRSVQLAQTATGTTITDAFQITNFNTVFSTVALNTGAKLPSYWPVGAIGYVQNNGANPLNLFPPTSTGTINGGSAGAAVTIAAAAGNLVIRLSSTDFAALVVAKEA